MNLASSFVTLLVLFALATASVVPTLAQQKGAGPALVSTDSPRTAVDLYEEAASYEQKRFKEFDAKKLPYDPKLHQKTKDEMRDIARRNAALLAARNLTSANDIFYQGLL